MKRLILAAIALTSAVSAFAQGTVVFNNRVTGTLVTHVYLPGASGVSRSGNGTTDTPTGTTDWTGFALIGSASTAQAAGYMTVLLAAPGAGAAVDTLVPSAPNTTFRTGTAAGQVAATTATLGNVLPDSSVATLALAVWDNSSGLYSTWSLARQAWLAGNIAAGISPTWNQDKIGGSVNPAPNMINSVDPSQHLSSFNVYFIPEPSSFALAGLGAAALMIFRRRK